MAFFSPANPSLLLSRCIAEGRRCCLEYFPSLPPHQHSPFYSCPLCQETLAIDFAALIQVRHGSGFESCGLAGSLQECHGASLQALVSMCVFWDRCWKIQHLDSTSCTPHKATTLIKGAWALADKLPLCLHSSWLHEIIPASWRDRLADLRAGVIFLRHVFIWGLCLSFENLFACKGLEREPQAGILLGADLNVI